MVVYKEAGKKGCDETIAWPSFLVPDQSNPGSLVLIHPNSSCDLNAGTSDTDKKVQQETEDTLFHPWVVLENPGSSVNFPNGFEGRDGGEPLWRQTRAAI